MRPRSTLSIAVTVVIGAAAVLVPLPLVVISPGSAEPVPSRVTFEGEPRDKVSGQLYFLTVAVSQPTPVEALSAWLDGDQDVLPRQRVIPKGVDENQYVKAQRQVFGESARVAAAVGLRAAGRDVRFSGKGARVAGVVPGSPAHGKLQAGDVIVAVDGRPIALASDLIAITAGGKDGDIVRLSLQRDGAVREEDVRLRKLGQLDRPALGISVSTEGFDITLPFQVKVDQGQIGGPSAGFMIALTVFELADDGDLARGRKIAGTGTIDANGGVGPVGGVPQKVRAAEAAGATLFLVPPDELRQAREAAGKKLKVMAVSTLDQAIQLLSR
ncbi:MAG TPA: PDZ domain-containing protein [Acidimicrobiales bacterium]|nr:PDZ domain-containing protein [Acidimicrobiales bacterium]